MTITEFTEPSSWARNTWQTILSDPNYGFNTALSTTAPWFGVDPFTINFAQDPTLKINFVPGEIAPDLLVEDGPYSYPCMSLFAGKFRNLEDIKNMLFSGSVTNVIDMHIPFIATKTNQNFESMLDAVKAALFAVFSTYQTQELIPSGLSYNGGIEVIPLPVRPSGPHWLRTIRFVYPLRADVEIPIVGP